MVAEELPPIRTPVLTEELALALCSAYRMLEGVAPARDSIVLLLAHSALETGRWKSCMCWNLGNIKSKEGDGRSWTYFRCSEIIDGKEVFFEKPSPVARFRAFHTLTEGAIDHIAFLCRSQRYAKAWAEVVAGRPREFVRALKAAGYFTAVEGPYEDNVANYFELFKNQLHFEVPPAEPVIDDDTRARTLELVDRTRTEETEDFRQGSPLPDDDEAPATDRNT
jgi:hypothetical protein